MAYQVLARKYRPQRFSDVIGQDHVTRTLLNALSQNRIAQGYIFSGHRGIGKTTIARILAMALNCQLEIGSKERPTPEPCGVCVNCREISAASRSEVNIFEESHSFDVEEIDAATRRGIDDAKLLTSKIQARPTNKSKYKILILDEAHQITDAAWNALLKTLEEPPEWAVFMFATTQPEDIPQTVRSRCQHFSFHAVKLDDILKQLRMVVEKENLVADEAALSLLAEAGDGSMRDALSIMDQAIASAPVDKQGRAVLEAAQIRELMGTVSNAVFEEILEAVSANNSAGVIVSANKLLDAGNSPAQLARQFVRYLRNCVVARIAGITPENDATELLQISPDERCRAARTAMLFTEEELARFLQIMLRTFDELGYRQEQRFHFELGLLKLVHLQRLLPVEEILSGMPIGGASSNATRPATIAAPSRPAPSAPATSRTSTTASSPTQVVATPTKPSFSPFEADRSRKMSSEPAESPRGESTVGSLALAPEPPRPIPIDSVRTAAPIEEKPAPVAESNPVAESRPIVEAPPTPPIGTRGDSPSAQAPASIEDAQSAACKALSAKKHASASDELDTAAWTVEGDELRIQTAQPKTLLNMLFNAEATSILKTALREKGFGALKLTLLPQDPAAKAVDKKPKAPRTGSVQAKAMEHPLVQQAQKLFNAEIRNVMDLRKD